MENNNQDRDVKATLKKNWILFKQSKLGMTGLGIVIFFGFLAVLQPILFLTNVWDEGVYHPVVGYDAEKVARTIVECPDQYPTKDYQTREDCPKVDEVNIRYLKAFNIDGDVGEIYESNVQPAPPSRKHILGTDSLGRDIFSQIMEGCQVAFVLGLISAIIGVGISTLLGTAAAFYGGALDTYLMRQSDLVLMLPSLPFLFIISAFAELQVWHLAVVLGLSLIHI